MDQRPRIIFIRDAVPTRRTPSPLRRSQEASADRVKCSHEGCGKTFGRNADRYTHEEKFHGIKKPRRSAAPRARNFRCLICDVRYSHARYLREHMTAAHDTVLKKQEFSFVNISALQEWLSQLEKTTDVSYARTQKPYVNADKSIRTWIYSCNRSGVYGPKKPGGTAKQGYNCPHMVVALESLLGYQKGSIEATYYADHNHARETKHLRLPVADRRNIIEQLKADGDTATIHANALSQARNRPPIESYDPAVRAVLELQPSFLVQEEGGRQDLDYEADRASAAVSRTALLTRRDLRALKQRLPRTSPSPLDDDSATADDADVPATTPSEPSAIHAILTRHSRLTLRAARAAKFAEPSTETRALADAVAVLDVRLTEFLAKKTKSPKTAPQKPRIPSPKKPRFITPHT